MKKKKRTKEQGQTIIELLIATLVVGSVVTAVAVALTYNIKRNAEVRYRQTASTMSNQVLEVLRRERELNNWESFYNALSASNYCLADSDLPSDLDEITANSGTCGSGDAFNYANTSFQRELAVSKPNDTTITFTVTVRWNVGSDDVASVATTHEMRKRLR